MDKDKKNEEREKESQKPTSAIETTTDSIGRSTGEPSSSMPPIPEIKSGPNQKTKATALEAMAAQMAEENIQEKPSDSEKSEKSERAEKLPDLPPALESINEMLSGFSSQKEGAKTDKSKKEEEKTEGDSESFFPGLKKIGETLGLSKKKPESEKKE